MMYWINTVLMRVPAGLFSRACAPGAQPTFPWRSLIEIRRSTVAIVLESILYPPISRLLPGVMIVTLILMDHLGRIF